MSRLDALRGSAVDLQAAHARAAAAGRDLDLVARRERARDERARDHRAEPAQGEGAVHGQAQETLARPRGHRAGEGAQGVLERVEALTRPRGHAQDGRIRQEGPRDQLADLHLRQGLHVGVGGVALGEGDQAAGDAQEPADVEVLAGLRHDRLVGGHHQQHGVDPVGAGQHVAHEALVARDVDEGCDQAFPQVEVGEPQVDRDPPLLLFLQAVGVYAGQGAHEGALPVVDVTGRADDQGAHDRPPAHGWKRTA